MVAVCFCGFAAGTAFPGSPAGVFVPISALASGVAAGAEGAASILLGEAGVLPLSGAGVLSVFASVAAPGFVRFSVEAAG